MLFSYEDKYIADFQICVSVPLKMYCPNTLRVYTETMLPFECFTIDFYWTLFNQLFAKLFEQVFTNLFKCPFLHFNEMQINKWLGFIKWFSGNFLTLYNHL